MKKAAKIVIILLVIILVCQSFALLLSQTGLRHSLNQHVVCTYTIQRKENLAQVFSSNPNRKEWLNKSKMPSREKRECFNNPEAYDLVYFDLEIKNTTDFWIMLKPKFKDTENVWFVREAFIQNVKGTPVKAAPQDNAVWSFGMIVKTDTSVKDIDQRCFQSLAFAKLVGGPYVTFFTPQTGLLYSDSFSD